MAAAPTRREQNAYAERCRMVEPPPDARCRTEVDIAWAGSSVRHATSTKRALSPALVSLFDEHRPCHTTSGIQATKIMAIAIHTAMRNGRTNTRFVSTPHTLESSSAGRSRGVVRSWR